MSRTEGINLPRLPTSHARVTSSRAIQPHPAGAARTETRRRSLSEPSYTAYVGTPRQDIPHHVFSDAAMYDDVFDKEGRLLSSRSVAKFTSPLNTVGYNSLNDPHCRNLFLNSRKLRSHLIDLGLITDDLKVVATTREQRQKIRAHELLERKEMLAQKLEHREQQRLERLSQPFRLPQRYQDSMVRQDFRRQQLEKVQDMKTKKMLKRQEREREDRAKHLEEKKAQLATAMEEARLQEQAHRNAIRAQQEVAEVRAYKKAYGKYANWHWESDKINNRMVAMQLKLSKNKQQKVLSESFPPISKSRRLTSLHQDKAETPTKHEGGPHGRRESGGGRQAKRKMEIEKAEKHREKGGEKEEHEEEEEVVKKTEEEGEGEGETTKGKEESEEPASQNEGASAAAQSEAGERDVEVLREEQQGEKRVRGELTETKERDDKPQVEESSLPPSQSPPHTSQEALATVPHEQPPPPAILEQDDAKQELTQILIEAFYSIDGEHGTGYLSVEDFLQVLSSRDLGLQLEENEQLYIASQVDVYVSGVIAYADVAPLIPDLLFQIFAQRMEQSMQHYGYYADEQWVQIYPVSGGVAYLNKLTGTLQYIRPDDFRPYLKDEVFEDSVVDFFETADTDRDGLIDYEDFYNLLASPLVASRVYRSQMEQLLGLYQTYAADTEGKMGLAEFSIVASSLLLMIYQNAYPDVEEWIELESKKFGLFWLNKNTGETILSQQQPPPPPPLPAAVDSTLPDTVAHTAERGREGEGEGERLQLKSRKRKKHKKKVDIEASSAPPKLTPRPKSRPSQSSSDTLDPADTPDHPASTTAQQSSDAREDVKPVSSRSRLIGSTTFETIPEEDETALEDSLVVGKVMERTEDEADREGVKSERDTTVPIEREQGEELEERGDATTGDEDDVKITTP